VVGERKFIQLINRFTLDAGKAVAKMALGFTFGQTELDMKETGKRTNIMVEE
jgi:hypothetical protein